ncbi:MAG: thiol oxidoreductase-like protein [Candidatus Nitronauta litoralis]|uniref:Thiol oxidoreductase-like protein n=1 Tax=Candidatus Nitronauta litoralis TaxID=2705533 RepID=A0A7T0BZN2_9BACT|nr:MAG: thiol oxidoreductase-like protein [Candidatus Nitronauta litoralis]
MLNSRPLVFVLAVLLSCQAGFETEAFAQLTDITQTPNTAGRGIALSLEQQISVGSGNITTPDSSHYQIKRDPARAIRRGRQLFQRKFTRAQGQGPRTSTDGIGDIETIGALGAGLSDSCAACHGLPRGSAGFGGDVVTRPDGRNAPHLFGLGLKEQLADEITRDLRALREQALIDAAASGTPEQIRLKSKGIHYGKLTANPDGTVDTSQVKGINPDLRVRPFFAEGGTVSIREFVVGALSAEMGLQSADPCLKAASAGGMCVTPSGMVLDGALDAIEAPPIADSSVDGDLDGVTHEVDPAVVDYLEFYLLNYFKPGTGETDFDTQAGFELIKKIGCTRCHQQNLKVESDRRVADVETRFNPKKGQWNRLFAKAETRFYKEDDGQPLPLILPDGDAFRVNKIFTDFKRHDLGPNFHELNYDGTIQKEFMTAPLWGVGSTAPYGHDGRSISLKEVILRHGGEAEKSQKNFRHLPRHQQDQILKALRSLILFPPDNTASNLNEGDPTTPGFPQFGQGKIDLSVLFSTPGPE